jgi:UDP-glucose 4-epimerase
LTAKILTNGNTMKILVTGGAGYIGSHATRLFLAHGHEVVVFDNLSRGHRESVPKGRLVIGELADTDLLQQVLLSHNVEGIVHFAGLTYVGESVEDPARYYRNNIVGTLSLLEAARVSGVRRIVFSSTAAVYGTPERVPIQETDNCAPINPYGRTKLAIEEILLDYLHAYDIGYAALRYFNAAGADPSGEIGEDHAPETHLIPLVLQVALRQRSSIAIFGDDYETADGTCIRDYIHVNDLAQAHLLALEWLEPGKGGVFNLGTGVGHSVREVISRCREVTGKSIPETRCDRRLGDPAELIACPESAKRILGWTPRYDDIAEIIATAWRWHSDHPQGYRT